VKPFCFPAISAAQDADFFQSDDILQIASDSFSGRCFAGATNGQVSEDNGFQSARPRREDAQIK